MKMILANQDLVVCLDPSKTRTGLFICTKDCSEWTSSTFSAEGNFYEITQCFGMAETLACQVANFVAESKPRSIRFVIEYPVMASRSGGYLAIFTTTLNLILRRSFSDVPHKFIWIPPAAVASFTKTKGMNDAKTKIVKLCQSELGVRLNHDSATAYFLYKIYLDIVQMKYKNSYKIT